MKTIFILMCMFFLIFKLSAQLVSFEMAKSKAQDFFFINDDTNNLLKSATEIKVDSCTTFFVKGELEKSGKTEIEPALYVINRKDKPGFIIFSADYRIKAILGYSLTGTFSTENMPPALLGLLDNYIQQIEYAKKNIPEEFNIEDSGWFKSANLDTELEVDIIVEPLLKNINFQQGEGWNKYCPTIDNQHTKVGCTAVAMAEVMKYWKYPAIGIGNNSYTWWIEYLILPRKQLSEDFSLITYNWEIMSNNTSDDFNSLILYHCGISVNMQYGLKESSLTSLSGISNDKIVSAFKNNFSYNNSINFLKAKDYSQNDWLEILKNELLNKRPIIYSGDNGNFINNNGHVFVLDGFNNFNWFHINWGWEEAWSIPGGYYLLSSLNPTYLDENGNKIEIGNFSFNQEAVVNIIPNLSDLVPIYHSVNVNSIEAGKNITVYCAEKNNGSISAGANVISVHLSPNDILTPGENGDQYIGEISVSGVAAGSISNIFSKTLTVPANFPTGSCHLFFSADGGEDVTEYFEDNNQASVLLTVTASTTLNPPTSLNATSGDGQVALSWSKPTSGTPLSYNVYKGTSENSCTLYANVNSTTFNKTVTGLTNGTKYWFYVTAVYSTGESAATSKVSGIPASAITYYPPRNLAAAAGNGQVSLCWSAPSSGSPSSYIVYMGNSENGSYSFYSSSTTTCKLVTGLANGTTYWFYVTAVYQDGISDKSNKVSGLPKDPGSTPTNDNSCAPQSLTIKTSCSHESFTTINATSNSDITFYGSSTCTSLYKSSRYDDDVWFYIQPTSTSPVTITVVPTSNMSNFDIVLGLYTANNCLTPGQITCGANGDVGDPEIITFTPQANTGYLIRVFSYGETSSFSGTFDICVTSADGEGEVENEDDFYIENVIVESKSIPANGTTSVSCEQCYSGNKTESEISGVNLGYYLSTNSSFGSSDIQLGTDLSGIGDNDPCNSESANLIIPGGTSPGDYYILFVADFDKKFDETSENNNVVAVKITVTESSHDFYILNESVLPDRLLATGLITLRCELCYSGSSSDAELGNCHVGYYFSTDKNFNSSSDIYIGSSITSIGADKPIKELSNPQVNIPAGISPGIYYIIFVADYDGRFVETDENNNVKYVQITVVESSVSEDYYIQNSSISSSSVVAGETIDATCTQCYIGSILDANIGSSYVGYYLSTNTSFNSIDDIRLGTDGSTLGSDYPFESESATLTIPVNTGPGTYYILFVADYDNRFAESDENNNLTSIPVHITSNCELSVSESSLDFTDSASDKLITINSNSSWTVSSDSEWLTVSPLSGSNNSDLSISVSANNTVPERNGIITVSGCNISKTISVTQAGSNAPIEVTAGNLINLFTAEELATITKLTLTGTIDARDFKTMRDEMPLLAEIDLSGATIVAYSGTEGTAGINMVDYPINTIPINALHAKESLINVIPPNSVTTIGDGAFTSCTSLKNIPLSQSVTVIDINAFSGCTELNSIVIPSSVILIGGSAFTRTGLTSILVPSSVIFIGNAALHGIGSIEVEESNPNYSSIDGVLYNKTQSSILQCPVSKTGSFAIPSSVSAIGDFAFYLCRDLTTISIPSSVNSIGYGAFMECYSLTTISIPSSVNSIGNNSFFYCNELTSLYVFKPTPVDLTSFPGVFEFVNKATCILNVPYGTTGLYSLASIWQDFENIIEMPGFTLSATTANLANNEGSTTTIDVTANVTWTASSDQTWLTISPTTGVGNQQTVTFTVEANPSIAPRIAVVTISADGVESQTITITQASSNTPIAVTAGNLINLFTTEELATTTKLTLTGTIDARDFKTMRDNMPQLAEIDLSGTTIVAYTGTEGTSIWGSIDYHANVVPENAFRAKKSLKTITFPNSTTSIDHSAFTVCIALNDITLPSSVEVIGDHAFDGCSELNSVIIPSSVISIGGSAFSSTGLYSIIIPSEVTFIGDAAFYSVGFIDVDVNNSNYSSIDGVLYNKSQSTLIQCPYLKTGNFVIPSTVTKIGILSFYECKDLTSITIPSSVISIEYGAFIACNNLTSISIPTSVISIGDISFWGCIGLTSIYVYSTTPIDLNTNPDALYDVNKTNCKLYVPYGSKTAYKSANQWQDFKNIIEMPGFILSSTTANIEATEGSITNVNISSDVTWTTSSDQTWLTISPTTGIGNQQTITFTAEANPSSTPRFATVTISADGVESQIITVTQVGSNAPIAVTAGNLIHLFTTEELATITKLTLSGTIDARDFRTIRDNMPLLKELDLSGVTVVSYTGTEGTWDIGSVSYPTNEIPSYAFCDSRTYLGKNSLRSILLPSSVISIGYRAFCNCSGLISFTIPSWITKISSGAYRGCSSLTSIYVYRNTPLDLTPYTQTFDGVDKTACKLYVPYGSSGLYSAANKWKDFENIVEMSDCPQHFHTVWEGTSGFDHMNVNIIGAQLDVLDLEPGDEIGVFDGDLCVGHGKVEKSINQQDILSIIVSKSDGSGNGYITGNEVSYFIWDCSAGIEYKVTEILCFNSQFVSVSCLPFEVGATSFVSLKANKEVCFTLELRQGWNIFASPVQPIMGEMETIFQSLIDNTSLVKIQDEAGNSLENWGIFGGWQNNIGTMLPTEGYKIKVSENNSNEVCGFTVNYPYKIPLQSGWNIMGYPQINSYDGVIVLQQLINRGTLVKVQNELGNSIEDWGIFGGWTNNIGDFMPGKGYKIKVSAKDTLWIYGNYPKSTTILPELAATVHFQPGCEGNGVDHMNINVIGLPINMLRAGDEIAVFDNETCVGAVTIMPHHLKNQSVSIAASASDIQGMSGFSEGSRFTLKLWESANNREFTLDPEILNGTETFTKHETTIASLEKYATTGLDEIADFGSSEINCYPNPFSDKITVEIKLASEAQVQVEILNQLGQQVKTITTKQLVLGGLNKLTWDGRNAGNQQVSPGVYHLKVIVNGAIIHKKIVYSK